MQTGQRLRPWAPPDPETNAGDRVQQQNSEIEWELHNTLIRDGRHDQQNRRGSSGNHATVISRGRRQLQATEQALQMNTQRGIQHQNQFIACAEEYSTSVQRTRPARATNYIPYTQNAGSERRPRDTEQAQQMMNTHRVIHQHHSNARAEEYSNSVQRARQTMTLDIGQVVMDSLHRRENYMLQHTAAPTVYWPPGDPLPQETRANQQGGRGLPQTRASGAMATPHRSMATHARQPHEVPRHQIPRRPVPSRLTQEMTREPSVIHNLGDHGDPHTAYASVQVSPVMPVPTHVPSPLIYQYGFNGSEYSAIDHEFELWLDEENPMSQRYDRTQAAADAIPLRPDIRIDYAVDDVPEIIPPFHREGMEISSNGSEISSDYLSSVHERSGANNVTASRDTKVQVEGVGQSIFGRAPGQVTRDPSPGGSGLAVRGVFGRRLFDRQQPSMRQLYAPTFELSRGPPGSTRFDNCS
jgi:hypothetical protein